MASGLNKTLEFGVFDYFSVTCSITMNILSLIGISGNLLSIIVFCGEKFRHISINVLLAALSCADLALLVLAIPVFSLAPIADYFSKDNFINKAYGIGTCFVYPVTLMFQCASIWLLIAITLERWIAVCRPLLVVTHSTRRHAFYAIGIISVLTVLYNAVRFLEFRLENGKIEHRLRNNADYLLWYVNVAGFLTMCFIPLFVLIIFNVHIVHQLLTTKRPCRKLSADERNTQNTTRMLLCVVLVFICCYSFSFVLNLLEIFHPGLFITIPGFVLSDVNNILSLCNAASTWMFYLHFSSRYRNAAKKLFREGVCRQKLHFARSNFSDVSMTLLSIHSTVRSGTAVSQRQPRVTQEVIQRAPEPLRKPILDKL